MGSQARPVTSPAILTLAPGWWPQLARMALELSAMVGMAMMAVGTIMVLWGLILCYTTKGEYYNADEVQAMVAAEMLEEKRKKQEEEEMFDDIGAEAGQAGIGKKKKRGPMIAD